MFTSLNFVMSDRIAKVVLPFSIDSSKVYELHDIFSLYSQYLQDTKGYEMDFGDE